MRWLFKNARGRLQYALENPRYALRSLYRELTLADERFVSQLTGVTAKKIRGFLDEPIGVPEFAECLRNAESDFKNLEIRSADLYAKRVLAQYAAVRALRPRVVVETGVANGVSTAYLLLALHLNEQGVLYSVELGDQRYFPAGKSPGWVVPEWLKARWKMLLGDSREVLPGLLAQLESIDVFIHDSLHTYDQMSWEYHQAYPYIRDGGLLLSDDALWNPAFRDFAREVRAPLAQIVRGVGFLSKRTYRHSETSSIEAEADRCRR